MRSKNSLKTMIYGFILTFIIALIGLFKTKVLLAYLGEDSVAVYQVFSNIYTYLSLIDGGITSAMIFYLYKPLREKNYEKVSEIVNGIRDYLNKVGCLVIVFGVIVSLNIMFFIKDTSLSSNYIKICCVIFIIANAFSYFANSRAVLYEAEQRTYKASNLNHGLAIAKGLIEIILAMLGFDLLTLMISYLILCLIKNTILYFVSKKDHAYLVKTKKMDKNFKKETNSLFIYKITYLIFENIDVMLLSKYVGSVSVIIYTAYFQITHMITIMAKRISSAIIPGIGDMLIDDDKKHTQDVFDEVNSMLFYIGLVICIPLYFVINPFINIWYGSKYVASSYVSLFFVLVLFTNIISIVLEAFIKSSGNFKSIRNYSLYQGVANLSISLLLVRKYGIAGVLFGTLFAFITGNFFSYPHILSKNVLKRKTSVYYSNCFVYLIIAIPSVLICWYVNSLLGYSNLLLWFINGVIIFVINFLLVTVYFKYTNNLLFFKRLKSIIKKK